MDELLAIFNQQATSGGFSWVLLAVSFLGGVIASLSPCTLGILPIIVGYIAGYGESKGPKTLVQMFFFILGMSFVLTTIGVICAVGGKIFLNNYAWLWALLLNGVILIMGLNLVGLLEIRIPVFIKEMPQNRGNDIVLYPMLIGAFFALASTPCSTPILAGIMAFASLSANIATAALMLFLFSLGQGLVLLIAGVFTSVIKGLRSISNVSGVLMKLSGVVLILASFYIYYKIFSPLL